MARKLLLAMFVLFLTSSVAWSQGVLVVVDPHQSVRLPRPDHWHPPHPHPPIVVPPRPVPPPQPAYKIDSLDVSARVTDQIAQVQVSQTFENTSSRQMEVSFVFPLPYDGAIDEMTLLVDGKEYPAELLDAEKARKTYEDIVRKNKDPALLEWIGTGMFRTSVFPVPAGAKRTVTLKYSQLLRMSDGVTDFLFPLSTAKYTSKPIEKINLRVTIESEKNLKSVYSPTHEVKIKRPSDKRATVSYEAENTVPSEDFRLLYDIGQGKVVMRVLSYRPDDEKDGFFLLLANPGIKADPEEEERNKTVIFVLDRSGSMSGQKIEQARDAMKFVMNNLHEGDTFNIVAYDSQVELFKPELQRFDKKTRKQAIGFCEDVFPGGSTNINAALETALDQLTDKKRPSYIIFLTDGLPTTGETNEMAIAENAKKANEAGARLFTFGVGYDVNSRLLDKLARDNRGQSEYVRPDEDIEERVSRLYRRIASPVLTDIQLAFELDEYDGARKVINRVYPSGEFDLFAGEQLVMAGRYAATGAAKIVINGRVGEKTEEYKFPAKLVKESKDDKYAFVEKLWAVRRIGEILDELDLRGKNDELVKELVDLSTRHGVLTPYTSFLADENTNIRDLSTNAARADRNLDALQLAEGRAGVAQRAYKGQLQRASNAASGSAADSFSLPAPASSAPARPGMGAIAGGGRGMGRYGGQGAMGGYGGGAYGYGMAGPAAEAESAEGYGDASPQQAAVRTIANRAFFQRGGQWIDSTVTEKQERNARRVKQFSDEYFELVAANGRELSQFLVFDEPVLLNFNNETFLIEP